MELIALIIPYVVAITLQSEAAKPAQILSKLGGGYSNAFGKFRRGDPVDIQPGQFIQVPLVDGRRLITTRGMPLPHYVPCSTLLSPVEK